MVGAEPSGFEHQVVNIPDYEESWRDIINLSRQCDESLGAGRGSLMAENRLVSRGLFHEDPFWNVWLELCDWLYPLSSSQGIVGYYQDAFNADDITFVLFGPEGVELIGCENSSKFEELRDVIVAILAVAREGK